MRVKLATIRMMPDGTRALRSHTVGIVHNTATRVVDFVFALFVRNDGLFGLGVVCGQADVAHGHDAGIGGPVAVDGRHRLICARLLHANSLLHFHFRFGLFQLLALLRDGFGDRFLLGGFFGRFGGFTLSFGTFLVLLLGNLGFLLLAFGWK